MIGLLEGKWIDKLPAAAPPPQRAQFPNCPLSIILCPLIQATPGNSILGDRQGQKGS